MKIIIFSFAAATAAVAGYFLPSVYPIYAGVSGLFFLIVGIGGIRRNFNPGTRDLREIFKEKDIMQKEKINNLQELLIKKEKELLSLREKSKI